MSQELPVAELNVLVERYFSAFLDCIRAGDGDRHPLPNSPCACHYEGRCAKDYPAGKKFDSSYDRGQPLMQRAGVGEWQHATD